MTQKTTTRYTALLCMAVMMAGATTAIASEVTGTLSSDTSPKSQTSGDIGGAVSSDSQTDGGLEGTVSGDSQTDGGLEGTVSGGDGGSSSGSSGGSSSSGSSSGSSSSNSPSGSVLGAATDNTQTPGFPNAGVEPKLNYSDRPFWSDSDSDQSLWSAMTAFLGNIFPL